MKNIFFEFLGRLFFILPKSPKTIQIEITNVCNLNCRMCPRRFLNVEEKHMNFEVFKKVINNSKGAKEIILTGWGEPLSYPYISQAVKYCRESGFKTRLTTNGVLLTNELAEKLIAAGLDEITFSLESLAFDSDDFGHIVKNQAENIENLARKKNRPEIIIQTTIRKGKEQDIFELINFAKKINAKSVNLVRIYNKLNPELGRPDFKEEKKIVRKAVNFGDKSGVVVSCFQHSLGRGFFRFIFKIIKSSLHRKEKFCSKLFTDVYINIKGELTPCCVLRNYKIGSLLEEPISDLWENIKFQSFRKNWKNVCQKCDAGQISQIN